MTRIFAQRPDLMTSLGYGAIVIAAIYSLVVIPIGDDMTTMLNGTIYASYGLLALSLAFVWGFAGILSFGQTAFFGVGAYAYAITALDCGDTTVAAIVAVCVAVLFAAMFGYFMFWSRVGDVYLGVITLTVSLILFRFLNQTAGDKWKIGAAPLGGFNGIPSTPILTVPGAPDQPLSPMLLYLVAITLLLVCYLLCKAILGTTFGRVIVAMRENETRAELLGYDTRFYKLGAFCIGGAIAGAGGVIFASSVFVSPAMFSLQSCGQVLIWVIVGGLGTLAGPVIGCFLILMVTTSLGTVNQSGQFDWLDPNLILGALLTVVVMTMRRGLLPLFMTGLGRLWMPAGGGQLDLDTDLLDEVS